MWAAILEWARTLVGALVGVFIGARLTRSAQDRRFTQQRVTQQIDRARAAYQDAEVISHKLVHMLVPMKDRELVGPSAPGRLSDVPGLTHDLMGAAVKLRSDGAPNVARSIDHVWTVAQGMYDRVASHATVLATAEEAKAKEFGWHMDRWKQLGFALDQAGAYWADWLQRQEAMDTKRRRKWRPWRNRVATVKIQQVSGGEPRVTVESKPIPPGWRHRVDLRAAEPLQARTAPSPATA